MESQADKVDLDVVNHQMLDDLQSCIDEMRLLVNRKQHAENLTGGATDEIIPDTFKNPLVIARMIALKASLLASSSKELQTYTGAIVNKMELQANKLVVKPDQLDIIQNRQLFNDTLKAMADHGMLDNHHHLVKSKRDRNNRKLAGIYWWLINSGTFKARHPGSNRDVSIKNILNFLNKYFQASVSREFYRITRDTSFSSQREAIQWCPFLGRILHVAKEHPIYKSNIQIFPEHHQPCQHYQYQQGDLPGP